MANDNMFIRKRITTVFLLFMVFFLFFIVRIGWIQLVKGDELQFEALDNRLRQVKVESKRGTIYERNMTELAISISTDYVYAIPPEVIRSGRGEEIAEKLSEILEVPEDTLYERITRQGSWFEYIQRRVDFEKSAEIKELELPGISTAEESQRYYPHDSLASHLLGFAGIDNQGLEGLEIIYDDVLRGNDGAIMLEFDGQGKPMSNAVHHYVPPEDGHSIVLTIDETLQYIVERELDNIMNSPTDPESATIILMEPDSGKIRALASRPNYDPNNYADFSQKEWRNIAVSNAYEPGSTFKIITAAAALEENLVGEGESFYDPGYIKVGSETIRCWRSHRPHGSQTFSEAVQNSCNPAFVTLGLRLEEKEKGLFYDYAEAFGFGEKTGISLPGEAGGIMIPRDDLRDINVATISMGQGIAVTPIQMISAMAAVSNGGTLMKPQLVEKIINKDGSTVDVIESQPVSKVISEKTSQELLEVLEEVVSTGTGRNAYIDGYRVGGKTGTAQKPTAGGYMEGKYVASFLGVAPVDDPELVCLVIIDEPQGYPYYGGSVAAPIFQKVMEDSLQYMNVPMQYHEALSPEDDDELVEIPDLSGLTREMAEGALAALGLRANFEGSGNYVIMQNPEAHTDIESGGEVVLTIGSEEAEEVVVPDLTGKRIPTAANLLEAIGLEFSPQGSGRVVEQDPIPYEIVTRGSKVSVVFQEDEGEEILGP